MKKRLNRKTDFIINRYLKVCDISGELTDDDREIIHGGEYERAVI